MGSTLTVFHIICSWGCKTRVSKTLARIDLFLQARKLLLSEWMGGLVVFDQKGPVLVDPPQHIFKFGLVHPGLSADPSWSELIYFSKVTALLDLLLLVAAFFYDNKTLWQISSWNWMTNHEFTCSEGSESQVNLNLDKNLEWMAYELFLGKKNSLFFFPRPRKKKKKLCFEWMNEQRTFSRKKNTVPLV